MLLAIDPGTTESAYVVLKDGKPITFAKVPNNELLHMLETVDYFADECVIEMIGHYGTGMPAGKEVFETCIWIGQFTHAWNTNERSKAARILRKTVAAYMCGSARAKDGNIRQAIIDRYGGPDAIGKKKTPGPLYGISGDVWQALAVAITYHEQPKSALAIETIEP